MDSKRETLHFRIICISLVAVGFSQGTSSLMTSLAVWGLIILFVYEMFLKDDAILSEYLIEKPQEKNKNTMKK